MKTKEIIEALAAGQLSFEDYADRTLHETRLTDLSMDVGRTCSLKCAGMCYRVDRTRPTRADEYSALDRLIHEVRAAETNGLTNLTISGTEPFLHLDDDPGSSELATRRTFGILEDLGARPRNYRLGLVSNGLAIEYHWPRLEELARRGHLDYIDLSIDSGDLAQHDRIRGRRGAGVAVFRALIDANQRLQGVRVSTSSVLRPDNSAGLLQLIRALSPYNKHFFVTPLQPLSVGKGVRPVTTSVVITFLRDLEALLRDDVPSRFAAEVTVLVTGLYIYDLIQAGIFRWSEVEEMGGDLVVTHTVNGHTLRIQLAILPAYGLNLGLLEFTGDYLPHAHALQLPHEQRGEWVVGNIRDQTLHELHQRGVQGIIQRLIRARTNHACRDESCWSTCFGGMAFNMEDAALAGRLLTTKPTACIRHDPRRLPIVP